MTRAQKWARARSRAARFTARLNEARVSENHARAPRDILEISFPAYIMDFIHNLFEVKNYKLWQKHGGLIYFAFQKENSGG